MMDIIAKDSLVLGGRCSPKSSSAERLHQKKNMNIHRSLIPGGKKDASNKLGKFIESLQALLDHESSCSSGFLSGQSVADSMNSSQVSSLGIRVVRGPDWKWGDQDDGLGHAGTVVEFGRKGSTTSPEQTVLVQWDSGTRTNYRTGFQKAFDLRVVDSGPSGVSHPNHSCARCKARIFGFRWTCALCPEVDLCNPCYNSGAHEPAHAFLRVDSPASGPVTVPPRKKSRKVPLKGIFKGALVHRGPDWDWGAQDGGEDNLGTVLDVSGWDEESGRSVVSVRWNSNLSSNVYRVGHKGKVDLKYVPGKETFQGFYYPDHLPVLGNEKASSSNESKVLSPASGLVVGDKVKIRVELEKFKSLQDGFGGYSPRMSELLSLVGTVHRFTDKGAVRVQYPGRPAENHRWTINPKALSRISALSIGTVVRVSSDCDKVRQLQEGHWVEEMQGVLGKRGKVIKVYPDKDVRVSLCGHTWTFKPACLSVVPGSHLDNRDGDEVCQEERGARPDNPAGPAENLIGFASSGQLGRLKEELRKASDDIKSVRSALKVAAERGHLDVLKYLVNQYPDEVDVKVEGSTALHAAILQGHREIVERLLASGANVATTDDNGDCALHYAVRGVDPFLLESLCSKSGPSVVNAVNKKGCTALHVGVLKQSPEAVKMLLKTNIDVNAQDAYKDTALHEAIILPNAPIIEALVNNPKIDFRLKNNRGFNSLQFAALKGNSFALKSILVKARQLAEAKKSDGFSPLHLAALNGHYAIAKILLQVGKCSVNILDNRGQNPVHLASGQGHAPVVELLVNHMKKEELISVLDSQDSEGQTPLHLALDREGSPEPLDPSLSPEMAVILQNVLEASVRPDLQRSMTIALFLIKNGANAAKRNLSGFLPSDFICDPLCKTLLLAAKKEEPKDVAKQQQQEEPLLECQICAEVTSSLVTFQPCGHTPVCVECWTPRIKKCLDCKAPVSKSRSSSKGKKELLPHVRDLEARVRDFEDQFLCTICMERKKNVAFQCGHSACEVCVETLRSCHMCRGSVDKRINLY